MTTIAAPHRRPRIIDSFRETLHERTDVPAYVVRAIVSVRADGCGDMWDRERVLALAAADGHEEAAAWLGGNRHLYFVALRQAALQQR
jgi:hypothetical protein